VNYGVNSEKMQTEEVVVLSDAISRNEWAI